MKAYQIEEKKDFVGRELEFKRLAEITAHEGSKIIVVYGRRRIGKTELLEQAFRNRSLLKFEGLEATTQLDQMRFVMKQLADYAEEPLLAKIAVLDWVEVLKFIAERTKTGIWTIYFEEVQWLADYDTQFITALKYVWDNFFRHNPQLVIILCGSSPSFMINKIIQSRALYNRSEYVFPMRELNLIETKRLLNNNSPQEVMDAYLTIGGMPEYLLRLKNKVSVYINLCRESFLPGAFFAHEYERIFISSLADNKHYKKLIYFLSKRKFATRNEIMKHLKINSGGGLTDVLEDLELCGFIEKYSPFNLAEDSLLSRYCITDAYLQYYLKVIHPFASQIEQGDYITEPTRGLNRHMYQQWLGYAFERFCRKYHRQIATILGFSAINYRVGTYFNRRTSDENPGYQIDLIFDRDDKVITVCEIKYVQSKVTSKVIDDFEKKMELFNNDKNKSIQRVLISNNGPDIKLKQRAYFDRFVLLDDLFEAWVWR